MFETIQQWLADNFFYILFVLAVAYLAARFGHLPLAGLIRRTVTYHAHGDKTELDVKKRQDTLISISSAVLRVVIWLTAAFTIVRRFGIDPAPILAGAGVVGIALAFGAQSLIKDFVSGIFIILENQYRVGDVVTLDNASGKVEKISIRTTVVRDDDGSVHYIPNGTISHSVNKTMGYAKINLAIGVKPKTDVDKLAEIINNVGTKMFEDEKWHKKLMEPPRFLNIGNFNESALEVKITGKTKPTALWAVSGELRKRLHSAFERNNIELAPTPVSNSPAKKK